MFRQYLREWVTHMKALLKDPDISGQNLPWSLMRGDEASRQTRVKGVEMNVFETVAEYDVGAA